MKVVKKITSHDTKADSNVKLTIVKDEGSKTLLDNKQLLVGQKVRLQRECDFYRKKIEQLRYDLDAKENELASHEAQVQELTTLKDRLIKEIFEEKQKSREITDEMQHQQSIMRIDIEAKRKELLGIQENSKNELNRATHELSEIENKKKELKDLLSRIETDIQNQERALRGIQLNVDSKKEELSYLAKDYNELEQNKNDIINEINELKNACEQYELRIIDLGRKETQLIHEYEVESDRIMHEHELERKSFEHEKKVRFKALNDKIKETEETWEKEHKERKHKHEHDLLLALTKTEADINQKIKEAEETARKVMEQAVREGGRIRESAEHTVQDAYRERQRLYDEGSQAKLEAVESSSIIIKEAHQESESLRSAAIEKMKEADSYYINKNKEAEIIVNSAKAKSSQVLQHAEYEKKQILKAADDILKEQKRKSLEFECSFKDEIEKRKKTLQSYIDYRKDRHEKYQKAQLELFEQKLKKTHGNKVHEMEVLKRKEFKRIASLKNNIVTDAKKYVINEKEKFVKFRKSEMEKLYNEKKEIRKQIDAMKNDIEADVNRLRHDRENEIKKIERQELEQINLKRMETEKEIEAMKAQALRDIEREKVQHKEALEKEILEYMAQYRENDSVGANAIDKMQKDLKAIVKEGGNKNRNEMMEKAGIKTYNGPKKQYKDVLIKYGLKITLPITCVAIFALDGFSTRTIVVENWNKFLEYQRENLESKEEKIVKDTMEARTYRPEKNKGYKESYVDNILRTSEFVQIYEEDKFQNDWLLAAYGFIVNELELPEQVAIDFVSLEGTLIKELEEMGRDIDIRFKDETIAKMRDREAIVFQDIEKRFGTSESWKAFLAFRDNFFQDRF